MKILIDTATMEHCITVAVKPVNLDTAQAFVVEVIVEQIGVYNGPAEPDIRRSGKRLHDITVFVRGKTKCEQLVRGRRHWVTVELEWNPSEEENGSLEARTAA